MIILWTKKKKFNKIFKNKLKIFEKDFQKEKEK